MYRDLALITNSSEFAQTTNFTSISLISDTRQFIKGYAYVQEITVVSPSAGTFTADAATDVMTKTAHGFKTGLVVRVSNSGGALPSGLLAATDYYVIYVSADTFKLATSLVNANAGTAINITTNGTGTQTVTPTALAGANYKHQISVDGSTWIDGGGSTNITVSTNVITEKVHPMYNYIRHVYTLTSGQLSVTEKVLLKGE